MLNGPRPVLDETCSVEEAHGRRVGGGETVGTCGGESVLEVGAARAEGGRERGREQKSEAQAQTSPLGLGCERRPRMAMTTPSTEAEQCRDARTGSAYSEPPKRAGHAAGPGAGAGAGAAEERKRPLAHCADGRVSRVMLRPPAPAQIVLAAIPFWCIRLRTCFRPRPSGPTMQVIGTRSPRSGDSSGAASSSIQVRLVASLARTV